MDAAAIPYGRHAHTQVKNKLRRMMPKSALAGFPNTLAGKLPGLGRFFAEVLTA
jgi:hypothetical protein